MQADERESPAGVLSRDIEVRVENISKNFGDRQVLDDVSFEIRRGEVLGFLGPNGAGKTTTMRILTGFFPPSSGKVWINGQDLFKDPASAKKQIGYLPESVNVYTDMRVTEFLDFVAQVKGVPRLKRRAHLEEKISRCGLWDVRDRLIGRLSKGYRQRVGLAQALVGDPELLVLDEPTSGLDPKQIIEIRTLIRELGKERTLILSTHILPEVSMVCDRVLIINRGRVIASGTPDELEAGVKDQHEVFVVIGDLTKREAAMKILEGLPAVERIKMVEERKDTVSFSLAVHKGSDIRPVISRLFVQQEIPLLEIRSGQMSLEEIFMKLVVSEETPQGLV